MLSKLTSTDLSHSGFKFLTFKDIELAGVPVRAMRISYTGEFNMASIVLRARMDGVWNHFCKRMTICCLLRFPDLVKVWKSKIKSEKR